MGNQDYENRRNQELNIEEEKNKEEIKNKIIDCLENADGPLTLRDFNARLINISSGAIQKNLAELLNEKKIVEANSKIMRVKASTNLALHTRYKLFR